MTRYTMTEITQEADAWPSKLEDTFFVRGEMMRQLLDDYAVMREALEKIQKCDVWAEYGGRLDLCQDWARKALKEVTK